MNPQIADLIDTERTRQRALWQKPHDWGYGDCSSLQVERITKVAVLMEEVGEVAQAVLDRKLRRLHDELVQVAAVAVAWLEAETGHPPLSG